MFWNVEAHIFCHAGQRKKKKKKNTKQRSWFDNNLFNKGLEFLILL